MANRIQLRRDTTANWENINPILADGEPGYDIVTNEVRIGDGSTAWTGLTANTISGGGGTGTSLTNNGYTFSLETDGNLTLANVGYINAAPTVAFGNASNVIITAGSTTGCSSVGGSVILNAGTSTYHSGNVLINTHLGSWRFGADGMTSFPVIDGTKTLWGAVDDDFYIQTTRTDPGNDADIELHAADDLRLYAEGDQLELYANASVEINADYNGSSKIWSFGTDGGLIFPDGGGGNPTTEIYTTSGGSQYTFESYYAGGRGSGTYLQLDADNGSVTLQATSGANSPQLTFNADGNLTLPAGGTITEANVGLADALILTPANITYPGQQLRIYSTAGGVEGNHLHLTTGNLYATELYLGDDNYFVKLDNTGNVGIRATTQSLSSTALWTFDTTGNLTLPAGGQIQSPGGTGNVVIETNDGNNTRSWTFETNGNITFPDATTQGTAYQRVTGSWTVTTGSADYSFTVPQNGTYTMWVRGKCDNGIITWNATATVTNNNVPVLGQQFAWNYNGGGTPIELTDIPHQFVGTANTVISSNPSVSTPTNTFTFTINNTSGSSQTVYWGYVTQ